MKRALGAMTPWDTFYKATKMQLEEEIISEESIPEEIITEGS